MVSVQCNLMKSITATGFVLGLAGALLDFVSGLLILLHSMMSTNEMGVMMTSYSSTGIAWTIGLFALGALLLVTSFLSITASGIARMRIFGAAMVVYGIMMLVVSGAMFLKLAPMMTGYTYSGIGMFVTGALMIVNGSVMSRRMM